MTTKFRSKESNSSFINHISINKIKEKRISIFDSWSLLCIILNHFGGKVNKDTLILKWEEPSEDQFLFLLKIINKITSFNLQGTYSNIQKEWLITH